MRLIDADLINYSFVQISPIALVKKPYLEKVALKEAIDKIPTVDTWISVNDRIPMVPQYCMVIVEEEDTMTADQYRYVYPKFAKYDYKKEEWIDVDGRVLSKHPFDVLMWRFAPDLPEEWDI